MDSSKTINCDTLMRRFWKCSDTKDGKPVTLYTFTTDSFVTLDFSLRLGSMVDVPPNLRILTPDEPVSEWAHRRLAEAAIYHAELSDRNAISVSECDGVPESQYSRRLGGGIDAEGRQWAPFMEVWIVED